MKSEVAAVNYTQVDTTAIL